MAKNAHSISTVIANSKQTIATNRHREFVMNFNVIVTFHITPHTVQAVACVTDANVEAGGAQLIFDYATSIRSTSTYDSVMRRLRKAVLGEVQKICGLGVDDMSKISTCGNWKLWEQITGLKEADEAARSMVAKDGKFYF